MRLTLLMDVAQMDIEGPLLGEALVAKVAAVRATLLVSALHVACKGTLLSKLGVATGDVTFEPLRLSVGTNFNFRRRRLSCDDGLGESGGWKVRVMVASGGGGGTGNMMLKFGLGSLNQTVEDVIGAHELLDGGGRRRHGRMMIGEGVGHGLCRGEEQRNIHDGVQCTRNERILAKRCPSQRRSAAVDRRDQKMGADRAVKVPPAALRCSSRGVAKGVRLIAVMRSGSLRIVGAV